MVIAISRLPEPANVAMLRAVIGWAIALSSCDGLFQPATCELDSTPYGGVHDASFCDHVPVAVEGRACSDLSAAVPVRHLSVVTLSRHVEASYYAFRARDCGPSPRRSTMGSASPAGIS